MLTVSYQSDFIGVQQSTARKRLVTSSFQTSTNWINKPSQIDECVKTRKCYVGRLLLAVN